MELKRPCNFSVPQIAAMSSPGGKIVIILDLGVGPQELKLIRARKAGPKLVDDAGQPLAIKPHPELKHAFPGDPGDDEPIGGTRDLWAAAAAGSLFVVSDRGGTLWLLTGWREWSRLLGLPPQGRSKKRTSPPKTHEGAERNLLLLVVSKLSRDDEVRVIHAQLVRLALAGDPAPAIRLAAKHDFFGLSRKAYATRIGLSESSLHGYLNRLGCRAEETARASSGPRRGRGRALAERPVGSREVDRRHAAADHEGGHPDELGHAGNGGAPAGVGDAQDRRDQDPGVADADEADAERDEVGPRVVRSAEAPDNSDAAGADVREEDRPPGIEPLAAQERPGAEAREAAAVGSAPAASPQNGSTGAVGQLAFDFGLHESGSAPEPRP